MGEKIKLRLKRIDNKPVWVNNYYIKKLCDNMYKLYLLKIIDEKKKKSSNNNIYIYNSSIPSKISEKEFKNFIDNSKLISLRVNESEFWKKMKRLERPMCLNDRNDFIYDSNNEEAFRIIEYTCHSPLEIIAIIAPCIVKIVCTILKYKKECKQIDKEKYYEIFFEFQDINVIMKEIINEIINDFIEMDIEQL